MADRAAEDITAPKAKETHELHNARLIVVIRRILETHYCDARLPSPDHLILVAWEAAHATRWSKEWTPQRLGRARADYFRRFPNATRKLAATWPPPPTAIEFFSRLATAKQRSPGEDWESWRAAVETAPRLFTRPPRFAKQGPLPTRWALVLGAFAPRLASILVQTGAPVSTRSTSPFTKTCRDILIKLLPNEKMPAISTVSDALLKIVVLKRIPANA